MMKRTRHAVGLRAGLLMLALSAAAEDGVMEIAHVPYTITNSGSYILTDNLYVTNIGGATAIRVGADDVVIDMNGFRILGAGSIASGIGIYQASTSRHLTVMNGAVERGGAAGIGFDAGISAEGSGNVIRNVRVARGRYGIYCGVNGVVGGCTAFSNASVGIVALDGSVVDQCTATDNGSGGIAIGNNATVSHSSAGGNRGYGIWTERGTLIDSCTVFSNTSHGIDASDGAGISDCTVIGNGTNGITAGSGLTIGNCVVRNNGRHGISVQDGCVISGCAVRDNGSSAILARNGCRVSGCTLSENGGAGVYVTGDFCHVVGNICRSNAQYGVILPFTATGNRVEGNNLSYNAYGIYEAGTNNVIVKNVAGWNTTQDYFINGNGTIFPSSASGSSTSPWVNFDL